MESRIEKLIAFEKEIMPERLESTLKSLEKEYQLHGERADANFLKTAENMFLETARLQKEGKKKPVSYLCVSPLMCSAVSGEDNLLIALYDDDWYLDLQPVYSYWKPAFLFQHVHEDMDFFSAKAHKEFIRLEDFEIARVEFDYLNNFYLLLQLYCARKMKALKELPAFQQMEVSEDFSVLFGEYMGGMTPVHQPKEES